MSVYNNGPKKTSQDSTSWNDTAGETYEKLALNGIQVDLINCWRAGVTLNELLVLLMKCWCWYILIK